MSPLIQPGDYILSCRWPHRWVRPGQVVVVTHPEFGQIIKRVQDCHAGAGFTLTGDNSASLKTEQMGLITPDMPIALVLKAIRQTKLQTPNA